MDYYVLAYSVTCFHPHKRIPLNTTNNYVLILLNVSYIHLTEVGKFAYRPCKTKVICAYQFVESQRLFRARATVKLPLLSSVKVCCGGMLHVSSYQRCTDSHRPQKRHIPPDRGTCGDFPVSTPSGQHAWHLLNT